MSGGIEYKLKGYREFNSFVKKYRSTAVPIMRKELYKCSQHFDDYVKRSIKNTPKDFSRTYGASGHHPSKPYNPPAEMSGNLTRKMYTAKKSYGAIWYIQGAKYAPYLEEGTREHIVRIVKKRALSDGLTFFGVETKVSMKPRPYVKPALKKNRRYYNNRLKAAALRSIRNAKMGV
jgi:hypothetical protein